MRFRNRHPLSSSFSNTTLSLSLSLPSIVWELHVELVTLRDRLFKTAYLSCLWNCPQCSYTVVWQLAIHKTGIGRRRETECQIEGAYFLRGISIWSSPPPFFVLYHLSSDSPQTKRLSDKDRGENGGWNRVEETKETDKKTMAPQKYSLCQTQSLALYGHGTGNRLIIYPHNLSSGVAPRPSIIATSAQAAVKYFSRQALKILYPSICNAHSSCSSSSLSIKSY